MFMILFKWEAKILNKIYKTERYDKLATLQITNPDQINYSMLFQLTPGINPTEYQKVIECTNKLCRPNTKANIMQQEVAYLDSFMKNLYQTKSISKNMESLQQQNIQSQNNNPSTQLKKPKFGIEHVVVYSSLSKCRIWPKVLKSGIGFVPTLINFYNTFTKQYGDCLDFKFDPVILSQKYTKIMQKVNQKKRDHPKLISAIKNNNMQLITELLDELQNKQKTKNEQQQQQVQLSTIINNIYQQGKAITHIACEYASIDTIKFLASIGADFQLLDMEKQTALFYAVKRSDFQIVRYLIEEIKVNINQRQYQERTVLYLAAFQGDLQIVDYLYKNGANPELCSKLDRTPLSKACYLGNIKVVKYLLSINVDMLKQDNKGRTALHNAAWGVEGGRDGKRRGHIMLEDSPECVQLLLNAGHPVDVEDYDGFTPLFSAVSSMGVKSLRVLIKNGGNLNHKTKNQQTAVFIAAKYGHVEMLKILIQEYKLNYTDVDFHGYTPLCASITLETDETFSYLCSLYMKNNIPMQVDKIIQCCQQYQTTQNIKFIKTWMMHDKQNESREERILYLSRSLEQFAASLLQLKKKKAEIKEQIESIMRAKNIMYRKNVEATQKQKQELQALKIKETEQKYRIFQKIMQKKLEQQQLTEDKDTDKQMGKQKQKQISNNSINQNLRYSKNKELEAIRKLYNSLLDTTSYVLIELQKNIRSIITSQMKIQGIKERQNLIEQLRAKFITNYNEYRYKSIIIYLLSQCVQAFNKSKRTQISDIVTVMLQLAKAWDITNPSIPPHHLQNFSLDNQISTNVHPAWLSQIKLSHNQSTHDILKLLTNKEVSLNLTNNEHSLMDTMFKLAKYRQTAVIIGIFSKGQSIGCFSYDNLLNAVTGNYQINAQKVSNSQSESAQKLTLIQYCILHGISDMAVYLQQICNAPSTQSFIKIPQYQIKRIELPEKETTIELQPVDQWVLNLQQIIARMSEKQFSIYKKFIASTQQKQDNQNNQKQQQIKEQPLPVKHVERFETCLNYQVVDTKTKLNKLEHALQKFILIGIDVQHYNVSKQQCFICSIQISNGEAVYIIDPLNHLQNNEQDHFTPEDVGVFMRRLMSDDKKIKIYHAYENDVKWIHEDFNLYAFQYMQNNTHKNRNVMDTSRIYGLLNRSKKGQSVGLRKLCQIYLKYEMEKNFQRSDWRIRPLFKEMIQYAAIDAEVLPYVYLRILSVYKKDETVFEKLKQGFCLKRNMKTRGVRNRVERVKVELPSKEEALI